MTNKDSLTDDVKKLLKIHGKDIVLDTNVLIQGTSEAKEAQRKIIGEFCKQNKTYITDTVYWEFLRHNNIYNFREKHSLLRSFADNDDAAVGLLSESEQQVQGVFNELTIEYMHVYKNDVERFIRCKTEDRWIMASALAHGIDRILTAEKGGDFLTEIYDVEEFKIGGGCKLVLYTYDFDKEEPIIDEIRKKRGVCIDAEAIMSA